MLAAMCPANSAGPQVGKERDVAGDGGTPGVAESMGEAECLQLISAGGVGRIGYTGRCGPTVVPVNYALYEGTIVFRTGQHSPMGEDLRTGIEHAESKVAFEIDEISPATRVGWRGEGAVRTRDPDPDHRPAHPQDGPACHRLDRHPSGQPIL